MRTLWLIALSSGALAAADPASIEKGRDEERRSCSPCHSLRIIHSQRLSRPAWERELDKMGRWGWQGKERQALLEYLVTSYGDDKPVPAPVLSGDGRTDH
jgi:hypothetical protein